MNNNRMASNRSVYTADSTLKSAKINAARERGNPPSQQVIFEQDVLMTYERMANIYGTIMIYGDKGKAMNNVFTSPNNILSIRGYAGIMTGIEQLDPKDGEKCNVALRGRVRCYNSGNKKIQAGKSVVYTIFAPASMYNPYATPTPQFKIALIQTQSDDQDADLNQLLHSISTLPHARLNDPELSNLMAGAGDIQALTRPQTITLISNTKITLVARAAIARRSLEHAVAAGGGVLAGAWSTYTRLFDDLRSTYYVPFGTAQMDIEPCQWGIIDLATN